MHKGCSNGCDTPVEARGLCKRCYTSAYRSGAFEPRDRSKTHTVIEVDRVTKTGVCQVCGPVRVRLREGRTSAECRSKRENAKRREPKAKRLARYQITPELFDEMVEKQEGRCAICHERKILVVDHDHSCCSTSRTCGKCVRGLLCHGCNLGLGLFSDDPELLQRAIDYLAQRR